METSQDSDILGEDEGLDQKEDKHNGFDGLALSTDGQLSPSGLAATRDNPKTTSDNEVNGNIHFNTTVIKKHRTCVKKESNKAVTCG